jgi:hypothetical protein
MQVTPHLAQRTTGRRNAIARGRRGTAPNAISQHKRKTREQGFGWMKAIGRLRSCATADVVMWVFTFTTAACNIVRLRRLLLAPPDPRYRPL